MTDTTNITNRPPKGYYKHLLCNQTIRIAFTNNPIVGCSKIPHEPVIEELEESNDKYAQFYIEGLKNGKLAAIVEGNTDRYFQIGIVYFGA